MGRQPKRKETGSGLLGRKPHATMKCPLCQWTVPLSWLAKATDPDRVALDPAIRAFACTHNAKGHFEWFPVHDATGVLATTLQGYRMRITVLMLRWLNAHGIDSDGEPILVRVSNLAEEVHGKSAALRMRASLNPSRAAAPMRVRAPMRMEPSS